MKVKHLILILCIFIKPVWAQYDYFQWTKTLSNNAAVNGKVPGSGLAVDQYDRPFYITPSGSNNRIYWPFGELLSAADNAKATSNLQHYADNLGDHLFYITSNDRIGLIEYLYANSNWSYNNSCTVAEPIAPGPSIAAKNTDQVFYIRASDRIICNFYKYPGGSGFGPVINNAPIAAPSSNLILNNDRVFYITDNYEIGCLKYDWANGWQNIAFPNGPAANGIAPGSKIQVRGDLNSFAVFFIGTDNKVYQYTHNPNYKGVDLISDGAPLAMAGTDILTQAYDEVRYVGVDGNVQSLFSRECGWTHFTLNTNCSIQDPTMANGKDNKVFFYSNTNNNSIYYLANQSETSGFVYRKGNKLMLNGNLFNPIGMNYIASIWSDDKGKSFYPSPSDHYADDWAAVNFYGKGNDMAARLNAFDQHLAEIASLGFNSIRFNDLHILVNPADKTYTDPDLYITYTNGGTNAGLKGNTQKLDQTTIDALFKLYDYVLSRAANYNLKVKFFIGLQGGNKNTNCLAAYNKYLQQFAKYFKNHKAIYSYAVLQEADIDVRIETDKNNPYYPSAYRGKGDICYYVDKMYNAIRSEDQNHLVNLSIGGRGSEYSFDPYILKVDFISFHVYPEASDPSFRVVRNEIQWMSDIMKPLGKPWIIGETGYPGNNANPPIQGTGSYADQKAYAQFILDNAFSAGASGVGWWQYRNVFWPVFKTPENPNPCCPDPFLTNLYPGNYYWNNTEDYFGIKTHNGSLKPVADVFKNYIPKMGCMPMYKPSNYYNALDNPKYYVKGNIVDKWGKPVINAVISGSGLNLETKEKLDDQKIISTTFSQLDGSFSVQADEEILSIWVTGLGYESAWAKPGTSPIVLNEFTCGQGNARMPNSLEENESDKNNTNFVLYPNPNNGVFILKSNNPLKGIALIDVTDVMGRLILKKTLEKFEDEKLDLSGFNNGVYFVQITCDDFTEVKKVIKK